MLQSQRQPPKLLDQVRAAIRTRHYSIRTEATYLTDLPPPISRMPLKIKSLVCRIFPRQFRGCL